MPEELARRIARLTVLPSACDIIRIAAASRRRGDGRSARLYFAHRRAARVRLAARAGGAAVSPAGYWQRLAVSAVIEELYAHQRDVTQKVLAVSRRHAADGAFDAWSRGRQAAVDRSRALLTELEAAKDVDLSMLAVASRQLRALTES